MSGRGPKRGRDGEGGGRKVCFDFQKGACSREKCKYYHPSADDNNGASAAAASSVEGEQRGGKGKGAWHEKKDFRKEYSMENEERHKGSFPLDEIKASEDYARRVTITDGSKRKYAVCFGYLGTNYAGLQVNPGIISVESHLERALFLSGAILECNFGNLQKVQWSRAARTDRGVHAIGQCCAMRLIVPAAGKEALIESINSFLPNDIRVFTMTKVSKSFNAKAYCSKRMYHYLLPTYTLSNAAEFNSEAARMVEAGGVSAEVATGAAAAAESTTAAGESAAAASGPYLPVEKARELREKLKGFRADEATLGRLRSGLSAFVGTHLFHNFTTGMFPTDAQSRRYVISFECGAPFVDAVSGTEWVLISVLGQSFLLNQIRRMVGMAVENARGSCDMRAIAGALSPKKVDIPLVPGLGLYLDELFFDTYNVRVERNFDPTKAHENKEDSNPAKRAKVEPEAIVEESNKEAEAADAGEKGEGDDNEQETTNEPLLWSSDAKNAAMFQKFKDEVVWRHIFDQEEKTLEFITFMDYLRVRGYTYETKEFTNLPTNKNSRKNVDSEE